MYRYKEKSLASQTRRWGRSYLHYNFAKLFAFLEGFKPFLDRLETIHSVRDNRDEFPLRDKVGSVLEILL